MLYKSWLRQIKSRKHLRPQRVKELFLREDKQQIANKNKMHYQLISASVKRISARAACGTLTAGAQQISPDSRRTARDPGPAASDLPTDSVTVTAVKTVPVHTNHCTYDTVKHFCYHLLPNAKAA